MLVASAISEAVDQAELNKFMDEFIAGKAGNRYTNEMAQTDFALRDVKIEEIHDRLLNLEGRCSF